MHCDVVNREKNVILNIFVSQVGVFFGGLPIQKDEETLKTTTPHIVVGTPGRILALIRNKKLNFKHLKHFILDECDKMLEQLGERHFSTHLIKEDKFTALFLNTHHKYFIVMITTDRDI